MGRPDPLLCNAQILYATTSFHATGTGFRLKHIASESCLVQTVALVQCLVQTAPPIKNINMLKACQPWQGAASDVYTYVNLLRVWCTVQSKCRLLRRLRSQSLNTSHFTPVFLLVASGWQIAHQLTFSTREENEKKKTLRFVPEVPFLYLNRKSNRRHTFALYDSCRILSFSRQTFFQFEQIRGLEL